MQSSAVTDQNAVYAAIIARIRAQIPEFSGENTCFLVADPDDFEMPQRQILALTVAPHSGEFDAGVFGGGGDDAVLERSGFTVTVRSVIKQDRPDEATRVMTDPQRGLFALKLAILRALLVGDAGVGWMPTDAAGSPLLTDYIAPVSAGFPVPDKDCINLSLSFSLNWAWDLS